MKEEFEDFLVALSKGLEKAKAEDREMRIISDLDLPPRDSIDEVTGTKDTLCCLPADYKNEMGILLGAKKRMGDCGHEVWIGPLAVGHIAREPERFRVVCVRCATKELEEGKRL